MMSLILVTRGGAQDAGQTTVRALLERWESSTAAVGAATTDGGLAASHAGAVERAGSPLPGPSARAGLVTGPAPARPGLNATENGPEALRPRLTITAR